ncbi:NAD(P)H-dependent oxidoreductase [uncultured Ferrovibrio sp.]|jgi:NAD(P)H dehydrogenase (quinone)|uniref:NAD(P)H-dependent oxidoreductase n=1 Tax=uncultured Ferrovibrio sp. TaxID=1576913 RepID=UPI0026113F4D|nr:NAD(P)H-dependent oxidoreductase [uncultured Ferrovibrio sp.]
MHALIVTAHPNPASLTNSIAREIAAGVTEANPAHSAEIADLAAEGFDPRFGAADYAVHRRMGGPPADVAAEQARIDHADTLVLVYPVYWWSMPGLLKGWIDRVFSNGWAYDERPGSGTTKKLQRLTVHLVAIGGADAGLYARHGYDTAMKTQIEHGIFDYCGARVVRSEMLLEADTQDPAIHLARARAIGRELLSAAEQEKAATKLLA